MPHHIPAIKSGANCARCPLVNESCGPVAGVGPANAQLLVVGDYPEGPEVDAGRPIETDWSTLRRLLSGVSFRVVNSIACYPAPDLKTARKIWKRNKAGSAEEACLDLLRNELSAFGGHAILALGEHAMAAVAKCYGVTVGRGAKERSGDKRLAAHGTQRGHPFRLPDGKWLLPSYPPKHKRRAPHWYGAIVDDIKNAAHLAKGGDVIPDPDWIYRPTLETILDWCFKSRASGQPVMVDIETAGLDSASQIRCVGLGQEGLPIIIVPRFQIDGTPYWTQRDLDKVDSHLRVLHDSTPLQFQNGYFDTRLLLHQGLMTNRRKTWQDLKDLHRNSRESDCSHKLASISSRFALVELWKGDVDHKALEYDDAELTPEQKEQREYEYHLYCARDIDLQMRSIRGVVCWQAEDLA